MYPSGLHFQKSSSSSSFDMSVYKSVSVSPAAEMPSSQLCFVYLSNYPSLIPLKDWLAGICFVFFPQSLWSCAHKYLLTARQKRWSPDPKPEGPESNEWRLRLFVFLIGKPISRSAACHCKQRAKAGDNLLSPRPRCPGPLFSTEAGACPDFTRLGRKCHLDQVLSLSTGPPCFATQTVHCTTLRTPFTSSVM